MNEHPQFDGDLNLYALGILDGEDKRALESHLAGCEACAQELKEARSRVARLALAVAPETPSPKVWERLARRVHSEPVRQRRLLAANPWRWATAALALTSLVLAVALSFLSVKTKGLIRVVQNLESDRQYQVKETARARAVLDLLAAPDTVKVTLVSGVARPVPQGKVFYNPHKGLLFYAANLPPLTADRTYQLWLVPAQGNPISAGVFQADAKGNGAVLLPALPPGIVAKAFAVTVEPAGGVPQPTGPKVLLGIVS